LAVPESFFFPVVSTTEEPVFYTSFITAQFLFSFKEKTGIAPCDTGLFYYIQPLKIL